MSARFTCALCGEPMALALARQPRHATIAFAHFACVTRANEQRQADADRDGDDKRQALEGELAAIAQPSPSEPPKWRRRWKRAAPQ
jgi:hypothetical protein